MDDYKDKIRKLLALAQSPVEAEAKAALLKARELMAKHKLTEAELTLVNKGGEVIGRWDYMELAGESEVLEITIPQCDEPLSLLYRVKDAAGNEMQTFQGEQTALGDFLVTTDQFVQLLNSPSQALPGSLPLLAPGAASLVLAAGLLHRKRRRA